MSQRFTTNQTGSSKFKDIIPASEINYPGASATEAFTAIDPYNINIQGTLTPVNLYTSAPGAKYDFGGSVPFINTVTGVSNVKTIQAWDPTFANSFIPPLDGDYTLNTANITNAGFPGRVDKQTINNVDYTMVRYNAGDGTTSEKCRSQLNSHPVPPRTRVRWVLDVMFGAADGVNDWVLTTPGTYVNGVLAAGASPVLFWQLKPSLEKPNLYAVVDTDINDPTKLMITFNHRTVAESSASMFARVHGISRYTLTSVVIDAFLDERDASVGGKGVVQISVNGSFLAAKRAATLVDGAWTHDWKMCAYLFAEGAPYINTRSIFWKTAKMFVLPA